VNEVNEISHQALINTEHYKPTIEVKVKENILIFTDIEYSHSYTFHKAKKTKKNLKQNKNNNTHYLLSLVERVQ